MAHGASTEYMSMRARAYLGIAAIRHILVGFFCLTMPESFSSSSYEGLRQAVPFVTDAQAIPVWGMAFIFAGVFCAIAACSGREYVARLGLLVSVITTGAMGGGFLAAIVTGDLAGPTGPVVWLAIALKDLTMLRSPLQNPFEPVVRRVLGDPPMRTKG